MKGLLLLNWQVFKVLIVKYQASCLDLYLGSLLINLSCKGASKPPMPNIALEQEVIAAAITIALMLYLHASDVHQHSTFNRNWTATLLSGTDIRSRPFAHPGTMQITVSGFVWIASNFWFRAYKKWIPLSSNFWEIYSRL